MRLSYGPWGESIREQVEAAKDAESGGFEVVWTPELHRSAWVPATAMAMGTSTIQIGTAIAYAFPRSAMLTALHALDLDELSSGRFVLGLGTGVRRLIEDWHDVEFGSPAAHLVETVTLVRQFIDALHEGEPIVFEGEWVRVNVRGYRRPFRPVRSDLPIYVGSVGPIMTRAVGEMADGWLGHELASPHHVREVVLPNLQAGIDKAGRAQTDVLRVVSACCVPHEDRQQARRWAAGLVAFYASVRTYHEFFAWHGFGQQAQLIQERFRAGDEEGMVGACTEEMVDAFTIAGTPDDIQRRLSEYSDVADMIKLSPPTHLVEPEVTRMVQERILSMFG